MKKILLFILSCICVFLPISKLRAHEVVPNIIDISMQSDAIDISIRMNIEAFLAEIDLSEVTNTDDAEGQGGYDALRSFSQETLVQKMRDRWSEFSQNFTVHASPPQYFDLRFKNLDVPIVENVELPRLSVLSFQALGQGPIEQAAFELDRIFGASVLRQTGIEDGLTQYLEPGQISDVLIRSNGADVSGLSRFIEYIPVGFRHVVPDGLDHIIFVIGLFLLSLKLSTLLWQVSAFTLAHSITLIAGAWGIIPISPQIIEPLIALSIVFIALENVYSSHLKAHRTAVVFAFGLLHGLGFASVLTEFGLPAGQFLAALLGFNVGVELAQVAIIGMAFALIGVPFGKSAYYRPYFTIPTSIAIAAIGAWWFVERVGLM